jgi:hypothetical protein
MTLADYIKAIGDDAAAQVLGISKRAAKSYRLKARTPRPGVANQIVRRSRGKLTMESIYAR